MLFSLRFLRLFFSWKSLRLGFKGTLKPIGMYDSLWARVLWPGKWHGNGEKANITARNHVVLRIKSRISPCAYIELAWSGTPQHCLPSKTLHTTSLSWHHKNKIQHECRFPKHAESIKLICLQSEGNNLQATIWWPHCDHIGQWENVRR